MGVAIAIPLVIGVGCVITFLLGYLIGSSVGYSKGRRDGCRRGLLLDDHGLHIGPGGFWGGDVMACTAERYTEGV